MFFSLCNSWIYEEIEKNICFSPQIQITVYYPWYVRSSEERTDQIFVWFSGTGITLELGPYSREFIGFKVIMSIIINIFQTCLDWINVQLCYSLIEEYHCWIVFKTCWFLRKLHSGLSVYLFSCCQYFDMLLCRFKGTENKCTYKYLQIWLRWTSFVT